jgi:hypothetical protein
MTPILAILYPQHRTKADGWDPGAWADLDRDGIRELHEQEANITPLHGDACIAALAESNVQTARCNYGDGPRFTTYASAWAWIGLRSTAFRVANPGGRTAVLALHCNAGGGAYGAVFHVKGSTLGAVLGGALVAELRRLPETRGNVRDLPAYDDRPGPPKPWLYRAASALRGVSSTPAYCFAALVEPGFLDTPAHAALWTPDGAKRIGESYARALRRFADG